MKIRRIAGYVNSPDFCLGVTIPKEFHKNWSGAEVKIFESGNGLVIERL